MNIIVRIFFFTITISLLLPNINLGLFTFRPDLFVAIFLGTYYFALGRFGRLPSKHARNMIIISLLITFFMGLSDSLGLSLLFSDSQLYFPRESIQIIARVFVFTSFFLIGFRDWYSSQKLHRLIIIVFSLALIWGLLQRLRIDAVNGISKILYATSEMQIKAFGESGLRVFGTAGNIIAWGGLCVLIFWYAFFRVKSRLLKWMLIALALANLAFSASRSSIIAMLVSFVFIQLFKIQWNRKFLWNVTKVFAGFVSFLGLMLWLFQSLFKDRFEYLLFRFSSVSEDFTTIGRGAQLNQFFSILLEDPMLMFFGIGKPAIDKMGYLEVEPAFLFVGYGLVGFVLQYLLLLIIFSLSRKLKHVDRKLYLLVTAWIVSYLIFSLGFFFFRELMVGLPFWWISGFFLGVAYRQYYFTRIHAKNYKGYS